MMLNRWKDQNSGKARGTSRSAKRHQLRRRQLTVENLEARAMLSATVIRPHEVLAPTANIGILLLDRSGAESLTRTGNGGIFVSNGDIVIDSSNSRAGIDTGNGNVSANNTFVHGGLKHYGHGNFQGNVVTGSAPVADPLANLPAPSPVGPFFSAVNVGNHTSLILSPGTYKGGIHVSGNASVTLLPGTYYLQGGGLIVSGNAKLTGDGVTIYNAPKNAGDSIIISGRAHVTLTAPSDGTYQGIVIFQARSSKTPIIVSAAGFNLTGVVYATNALLNLSGNGNAFINGTESETILAALIVKDLLDSGDGSLFVNAIASGFEGDLSVTKEDDLGGSSITGAEGSATAGGTVTYTITFSNNGPSNSVGATVSDFFPSSITSDTYTAVGTGGATDFTASGSGNIDDLVNLPSGSTITYTVVADISADATDTLSNTANVTAPPGVTDPDLSNNSATDVDSFTQDVDLSITKTDDGGGSSITDTIGTTVPGGTIVYTIVVSNAGPSMATGASVTDTFPAGITSDSFTAVGTSGATGFIDSGSGGIDDIVNMPVGSTITYTVTASISPSATGSLSNEADVAPAEGITDTDLTNNSAIDNDTLAPAANLAITKVDNVGGSSITPSTGSVPAGGTLTYTIVVSNTGPSDAIGVNISDVFPVAVSGDTFTASATGGATGLTASGSGTINNTVNLPAGSSITYVVTAHVSAGASVGVTMGNSAIITPPAGLTDLISNTVATDLDLITSPTTITLNGRARRG